MSIANTNVRKRTMLLLGFAVFWLAGFSIANADAGIQIKPSIIEDRVEPGQVYPYELHVTNRGSETETFYFTKRDITGIAEDGRPILADNEQEKTQYEASSWISIGQESLTLTAGEERSVPITIRIPTEMTKGGHFASILVTTNPPQMQGVGATVAYGASTIVALRVGGSAGDAIEEVNIREFRTTKVFYGKPDVTFIAKVANIGNVLVRPRGPLEITDMFGKKVASMIVNQDAGAVLPDNDRIFETHWEDKGFYFGRYQVVMSLGFGEDEKKTVSETLSFWILPSSVIIPVLGLLALVIGGLLLLTKLHIKRKMNGMNLSANSHLVRGGKGNVQRSTLVTAVFLACVLIFLLILFAMFA